MGCSFPLLGYIIDLLCYWVLSSTLGFLIKFKHMVALTNETPIVLSFPMTIKCNAIICLNLIGELNVLHLRNLYIYIYIYIYIY